VVGGGAVREERRVSWMPGAEGAPLEVAEEVFVVEEEWLDGGAMRSDCGWRISIVGTLCSGEEGKTHHRGM
jgi:hypothetical protein